LVWSVQSCGKSLADDRYDRLFQANVRIHLPEYSWLWVKAQSWQESRFNPAAVSPVGAMGLMQIMPATGRDLARRTGQRGQLSSPSLNIMYGAVYMSQMVYIFRGRDRTKEEKLPWAQGSYNCGAGCVLRAQKRAGDIRDWKGVEWFVPKETRDYVNYIRRWKNELDEIEKRSKDSSTSVLDEVERITDEDTGNSYNYSFGRCAIP